MRPEVFIAVKIWILVFWVLMPCSLVGDYQRFEGTYLFLLQSRYESSRGVSCLYKEDQEWEMGNTGQALRNEISSKVLKGHFQDRLYSNHPLVYFNSDL
jgi:hypothetical protein